MAQSPAGKRKAAETTPGNGEVGQATVLVVDATPQDRAAIAQRLQHSGYAVADAGDADRAIELARTVAPDVVLLDAAFPSVDGFPLLGVFEADPELASIPVIILTATSVSEHEVAVGLRRGVHDYLDKSAGPGELVARVQAALRVKGLRDALTRRNG